MEVEATEEREEKELTYDLNFLFQEATFLELQHCNQEACQWLECLGYNS
jgi:hypothetical protein